MGLCVPEDALGSSCLDEGLKYQPMERALRAGLELAVREGAGASKAELDVALCIEEAGLIEAADPRGPSLRVISTLDQKRGEACLCKREGTEEASASGSDDNRALIERRGMPLREAGRHLVDRADVSVLAVVGKTAQESTLLLLAAHKRDAHREHQVDIRLLAGIDRAAPELERGDLCLREMAFLQHMLLDDVLFGLDGPIQRSQRYCYV